MSKQYAHLHAMAKTSVKFQNDWPKTVGGVALTSQLLTNRQTDKWTGHGMPISHLCANAGATKIILEIKGINYSMKPDVIYKNKYTIPSYARSDIVLAKIVETMPYQIFWQVQNFITTKCWNETKIQCMPMKELWNVKRWHATWESPYDFNPSCSLTKTSFY